MKTKLKLIAIGWLLAAIGFTARAQVTAFTYQGRLNSGGAPATGIYDLRFTIYDSTNNPGTLLAGPVTNSAVSVTNGLFTTMVDFGNVFNGGSNWLQIAVRTNGANAFSTLSPRQQLTPVPYAIMANSASNLLGSLPATQLSGTVPNAQLSASVSLLGASIDSAEITDGTIMTNDLNASVLNGTFWKLGGNTGANPANGNFLGTLDNQPLEFRVNGQRGLRLEYANDGSNEGVNAIGGFSGNFADSGVVGATIAGGGEFDASNHIAGDFGTVGGGVGNTAGTEATVGGGVGNTAGTEATVGGGQGNTANFLATVGGGIVNHANGDYSTISGGAGNQAGGSEATVPGGNQNFANGDFSFAAGNHANANHTGTFVWADATGGLLGPNFTSTGTNQFLIRASGGVAIGTNDPAGAALRVAGSIKADSYLGMGATLMLGTTDNQPLELEVNGHRGLRIEYALKGQEGINVIGGYSGNLAAGWRGATIAGGGEAGAVNRVTADFGTIGGGRGNTAASFATVGGGIGNTAGGVAAVVGGGNANVASGDFATVPGGVLNTASRTYSFAAGNQAKATNDGAFVWADSQSADFASTGNNQFLIRASGGVAIGTNDPAGAALRVAGTVTADGLGIGTGSPGELLDVVVDESAKSYGGIRVRNVNPTIGGERTVLFDLLNNDPSSAVTYRLQNVGNVSGRSGNFEIYQLGGVAGGARLAITTNGNVGIGTTSPGSTLEVVSANEVGTSDGTGKISAGAQNASHVAIDSDDIQKFDNATTVGTLYLNYYGGSVEIGSASATTTIKGTFVNSSDRNLKEDIRPVKPDAVLDRLLQMPVSTWKFKGAEARRHVGPMAQDFHAAFNDQLDLQSDDKTIAPLDEAGVAFVSVQALNEKLEESLQQKETEITELKKRLEKLEQLLTPKLAGGAQ